MHESVTRTRDDSKKPLNSDSDPCFFAFCRAFASHSPETKVVGLDLGKDPTKMRTSRFRWGPRKTPKNLDTVGVHSPCIRGAFEDNVAHSARILLTFARIGVQSPAKKIVHFLPSLLFLS